jgi:cell division protein FtsL
MATAYRWNPELPEGPEAGWAGRQTQDAILDAWRHKQGKNPATANLSVVRPAARLTARNRKGAPLELYTVKKIDNSRLVRRVEPVKLRNYYKTVALGGIMAIFCLFYVYQHFRCIDLSFQLEDLKSKKAQAQALNSEMKLEIATLRDPRRIDVIARHQLGLTQPAAIQMREYSVRMARKWRPCRRRGRVTASEL